MVILFRIFVDPGIFLSDRLEEAFEKIQVKYGARVCANKRVTDTNGFVLSVDDHKRCMYNQQPRYEAVKNNNMDTFETSNVFSISQIIFLRQLVILSSG